MTEYDRIMLLLFESGVGESGGPGGHEGARRFREEQQQRVEQGIPDDRAIHDASMERFRPIMMTTFAALMGVMPIALGFGSDGASRRPLGLVIVGGLIVSQFITLYVTPAIYLYLEEFQEKVLDRVSFFRTRHSQNAAAGGSSATEPGLGD